MGFFRQCFSYICASCMLFVMAGVSFAFFDLGNAITGGLFVNIGSGITGLFGTLLDNPLLGGLVSVLIGGFSGTLSILMFPMHWMLQYRPDDPAMALALMVPWIGSFSISSALFAKKPKDALINAGILGGIYILIGIGMYLAIAALLGQNGMSTAIVDSIFMGLTDLHPVLAVFLATLEGVVIGGAFGALIAALKYKPTEEDGYKPKERKKKDSGGDDLPLTFENPVSGGKSAYSSKTDDKKGTSVKDEAYDLYFGS